MTFLDAFLATFLGVLIAGGILLRVYATAMKSITLLFCEQMQSIRQILAVINNSIKEE